MEKDEKKCKQRRARKIKKEEKHEEIKIPDYIREALLKTSRFLN